MSAVAGAGIPVPECFLSNDRKLFVMRRFDRRSDGCALGFEDMAVLMGLGADEKYSQSYEAIARTIIQFTEGTHTLRSLHQLFDMVAVSCIVGNGDAHLKNFGLIYQAPDGQDATLAPAYDIVNTTCYISGDALALTLGGTKRLYSASLRLTEFARTCRLPDKAAQLRIIEIAHAVRDTARDFRALADEVPGLYPALRDNAERYLRTFEAQVSNLRKPADQGSGSTPDRPSPPHQAPSTFEAKDYAASRKRRITSPYCLRTVAIRSSSVMVNDDRSRASLVNSFSSSVSAAWSGLVLPSSSAIFALQMPIMSVMHSRAHSNATACS